MSTAAPPATPPSPARGPGSCGCVERSSVKPGPCDASFAAPWAQPVGALLAFATLVVLPYWWGRTHG